MSNNTKEHQRLQVATTEVVTKKEIVVSEKNTEAQKEATALTDNVIEAYKDFKPTDTFITDIGSEELADLRTMSKSLDGPVKDLMSEKGSTADNISNSLLNIKVQADSISPMQYNLNPGFFGQILSKFGISTGLQKYAAKYMSVKDVIGSIEESLDNSILRLKEDNAIFQQDKTRYRKASKMLEGRIQMLMVADTTIEERIKAEEDEEIIKFLKEEVLFKVRTHTQNLQQTHFAAMQGTAALNLLISNNEQLMIGVKQTRDVTVAVMTIGFTIATGLATQKKIADLVSDINKTTEETMKANSKMLKTQGAQIQKQASQTAISVEAMTEAMTDLSDAIEDFQTFKAEALPVMKENIQAIQAINNELESKVSQIEKGNAFKVGVESSKKLEA